MKIGSKCFFFSLLIMINTALTGQRSINYFQHLIVEDGLSDGTNHFIYKDSRGFIWLSSLNGLNRYDGKELKPFRYNPEDPNSVHGQYVQGQFIETDNRYIWFTSFDGLNCYDWKQKK